jgi:hypothetical protein
MRHLIATTNEPGDLFGDKPIARNVPVIERTVQPEMKAARSLCRQLRRIPSPRDKQRIAHLICLNLLTMLKHNSG